MKFNTQKLITVLSLILFFLFVSQNANTSERLSESHDHSARRILTEKKPEIALGLIGGMLASNIEPGMFFIYGIGKNAPHNQLASLSIASSIMLNRFPTHISRYASIFEEQQRLISSNPEWFITAKYMHALLNHASPMLFMGLYAEKEFPIFALMTAPCLVVSNICKGIEDDQCPLSRIAKGSFVYDGMVPTGIIVASMKGLLIYNMVDQTLANMNIDQNTRLLPSLAAGGASTFLTWGFEGDKLRRFVEELVNNSGTMLFSTAQAGIIMSCYYGMGWDLSSSALFASGIYGLETVIEALSIQHHLETYIAPWAMSIFRRMRS